MPGHSGYAPLAQDANDVEAGPSTINARQRRSSHSIDLTKLDNAFKRWTESVTQKMKRKKKTAAELAKKPIWRSVFEPYIPATAEPLGYIKSLDHKPPMTQEDYRVLIQSVRDAIEDGIHPKMIAKGSSGSYFARARNDAGKVQTVAVFKPKDEEPYGRLNPKTTKWMHRQLRWVIPFGRACLIPNLSYISETAASLLDRRLELYIVPRTELVSLSSPAFFYDWLDRSAAKKGNPLPLKIGSMQYFMHGFQDASDFLRKHPLPGRSIADTFDDSNHRKRNWSKRFTNTFNVLCGKTGSEDDIYDDPDFDDERLFDVTESPDSHPFYWTQALQDSFREELEKLVILDYLMRNTDRGADNYMIKYCDAIHEKPLIDIAPSRSSAREMSLMGELRRADQGGSSHLDTAPSTPGHSTPYLAPEADYARRPHIHIAAIDNSLSFPHQHPQGWRSYTYGWLYLPVSVIGRPFSEKTRNHFLPLLTSKSWWEETTYELQRLFSMDPGFHPKMFKRQLALIKGQAWNIVQSLKHAVRPLELTRRTKIMVWDDELEVPDDAVPEGTAESEADDLASSRMSINTAPLPQRLRSHSSGSSDFPPPLRRKFVDAAGNPRPVPLAAKLQRIHPGTTGVTILEHLERLDAVEASLSRLGVDGTLDDVLETDVADAGEALPSRPPPVSYASAPHLSATSPVVPSTPLPIVREVSREVSVASSASSVVEEDLVALSKSVGYVEPPQRGTRPSRHSRWASHVGSTEPVAETIEWITPPSSAATKTVITERLETVDKQPCCSCW
ncbi:hypothetical protein FISHEDRAFT_48152 [Fistulina hepatica ATCC 64428]|uniref:Phosphatidylinositol 4-kinase n=1 Tax=Fistulina hepatica ATCC 64428 TaxID=1128425 RepID=A0A0D7A8F4_9AGAR|nr:hypothetical protein FISHEDRAFT_48152 [Fistulina hepatica ATCC 64428]